MSKYLEFTLVGNSTSGLTKIWDVTSKNGGAVLGEVSWYSAWRKYVFMPPEFQSAVVFDQACLRDIAEFIEKQTKEHKQK